MGVDWLTCDYCEENFPDCGEYVTCHEDCSGRWCSYECAEKHGLLNATCKLGCDVGDDGYFEYDVNSCVRITNKDEYDGELISCEDCSNYTPKSCKYCREEDYEDTDLLEKTLELLNLTREDLIKKMKETL